MFKKIAVVAGLATVASLGGIARADGGIDFTPFGPGGIEWTVSVPAFTTPFNYGQRTASAYEVPFDGRVRAGCFVLSPSQPWLRVGHRDGRGQFIPDFSSTWEGEVNTRTGAFPNVFSLQVEIMASNGAVTTLRKTVSAAAYGLEPLFFPTPSTVLYWGVLDQALGETDVVYEFPVHQNDQIRVSACDLAAGSSLSVRHLVLRTWPT